MAKKKQKIIYRLYDGQGKSYIGVTKNLKVRLSYHKDTKQFDIKEMNVEVLHECDNSFDAYYVWEPYYIGLFDSFKNGYNRTMYGGFGYKTLKKFHNSFRWLRRS